MATRLEAVAEDQSRQPGAQKVSVGIAQDWAPPLTLPLTIMWLIPRDKQDCKWLFRLCVARDFADKAQEQPYRMDLVLGRTILALFRKIHQFLELLSVPAGNAQLEKKIK